MTLLLKKTDSLKRPAIETTEAFNNYYINIEENTSGNQPSSIGNLKSQCQDRASVKKSLKLTKTIPVL